MKYLYLIICSIILIPAMASVSVPVDNAPALSNDWNGVGTELNIHPNPVRSMATITFSPEVERVVILNLVGRELMAVPAEKGSNTLYIDLSHLEPGVYFISAQSQGRNLVTRRFLKEQ